MSGSTISGLPPITDPLEIQALAPVVQGGQTRKATISDLATAMGFAAGGASLFVTRPTQPLNSWCDIRVPLMGEQDADNVLTLQNNSRNAGGKYGNAAIRVCAPAAQGGWEHCAWGFSARTDAKFFPGYSYWEIYASETSGFYPNAAIIVTHVAGTGILPARSWKAMEIRGDYGTVIFAKNDNGPALTIDGTTGVVSLTDVLRLAPTETARGARTEAVSFTEGVNGSLGFNGASYLARYRNDNCLTAGPGDPLYDNVGVLAFGGNHTNGNAGNVAYAASISGRLEGPFLSATNMPMGLVFRTGQVGVQAGQVNVMPGTPRMWLTYDGRLGVGVRTPQALLAVDGGIVVGHNIASAVAPPTDGALIDGIVGIGPGFATVAPEARLHVSNGNIYVDRTNTRSAIRDWLITGESDRDSDGFVYTRKNIGALFLSYITGGAVVGNDAGSIFHRTGITGNNPTTGALQFQIDHTASAVNNLAVTGAVTGGFPTLSSKGSDINISLGLTAKGTGKVVIGASINGLGFFGSGGEVKQTITGSRSGNAALASLLTALGTYGLINDSTST